MRIFAAVSIAAAAVLAGCGGSSEPASGEAASAVPASAAAYVSVQSDLDSAQWKQVEDLLGRFPDGERATERLHGDLGDGVNYERDVDPALGPTLELVWLDFANDGEDVVALTQSDDEDKLRELVRKGDEPAVVGEVDDWSAVARNQALIDRFRSALDGGALADDAGFQAATDELPDEALATLYADGEEATSALEEAIRERGGSTGDLESAGRLEAGAAALEAADEGFRLTAFFRTHGVSPEVTDVGRLLKDVPSGALLAVNFHGTRELADRFTSQRLGPFAEQFGSALRALASLLQGEGVLYVRPAAAIPEVTLLLAPPDAAGAKAQLDLLTTTLPVIGAASRHETAIADVQATVLDLGRFVLVYAAFDGRLVITTLPDGIRDLREPGDKLVDDDEYKDAIGAAGVGDDEHVVAYADLEETFRLFEQLAASGGDEPSPSTTRNLRPLRSLVASVRDNGDDTTVRLFVEIR